MTLTTGFCDNSPRALKNLYFSKIRDAMILPTSNSASLPSLDVSKTTILPLSICNDMSSIVFIPLEVPSKTLSLEINSPPSPICIPSNNLSFL